MKTAEEWAALFSSKVGGSHGLPEFIRKIQADTLRHALSELQRPDLTQSKIGRLESTANNLDPQ